MVSSLWLFAAADGKVIGPEEVRDVEDEEELDDVEEEAEETG